MSVTNLILKINENDQSHHFKSMIVESGNFVLNPMVSHFSTCKISDVLSRRWNCHSATILLFYFCKIFASSRTERSFMFNVDRIFYKYHCVTGGAVLSSVMTAEKLIFQSPNTGPQVGPESRTKFGEVMSDYFF